MLPFAYVRLAPCHAGSFFAILTQKNRSINRFQEVLYVSITLLAMGKLKEKFYLSAAAEYEKRLSGTCRFQLLELPECRLPETPQPAEIAVGLAREAELIRQKLPKGAWFCVFTPEGRELSSKPLPVKWPV